MYIVGTICAIGAGILFGFCGPLTKIAYNLEVGVGLAIILRYLIASILIAPAFIKSKPSLKIYKSEVWTFMLFTTGSILLTTGLLLSVQYIDVSLAILIFCTYPIIVLLTSILINKEKIKTSIKIVFFIIFLGLFLVLGPSFDRLNILGIIFAFVGSIGASTIILSNQKLSNKNINPIHIGAFINIFNLIFFIIFINLFFEINYKINSEAWLIILIASLSYAIAFFLQISAIPRIGQSKTALLLYGEPVVTILAATILLKERLNLYQSIGAAIVICSLIFATYQTNKN